MACDHIVGRIALGNDSHGNPIAWCCRCGRVHPIEEPPSGNRYPHPKNVHADRCEHPQSRIVHVPAGNHLHEWCHECGAIRRLNRLRKPATRWTRPGGPYGKNPGELPLIAPKKKKEQ